jgi:hypothetical protein
VLPSRLSSVNASDGSDFKFLAFGSNGAVKEASGVVSAGSYFLVDESMAIDGGESNYRIAITDGNSEPIPLLNPPDNEWHAMPGYAHSHIAWQRGINRKQTGEFERVEIWAAPFTPDPAALKPFKVGDGMVNYILPHLHIAGFGYYAVAQWLPNNIDFVEMIWNLSTKQSKTIAYPTGWGPTAVSAVGMTKTHAWIMAGQEKPQGGVLHRFSLQDKN